MLGTPRCHQQQHAEHTTVLLLRPAPQNQYLDPIQHLVLQLRVGGIFFGNSSNITVEVGIPPQQQLISRPWLNGRR